MGCECSQAPNEGATEVANIELTRDSNVKNPVIGYSEVSSSRKASAREVVQAPVSAPILSERANNILFCHDKPAGSIIEVSRTAGNSGKRTVEKVGLLDEEDWVGIQVNDSIF